MIESQNKRDRDTRVGFSVIALLVLVAFCFMIVYPNNDSHVDSYSIHSATTGPFNPPGNARIYR